ncbi:MAG TPA: SulP family inorganic anion transporter, partial [Allocoleopsis sp.]
ATGQEIEPNRELQTIGIANLIAGLGGGIIGFHCLGLSTLNLAKIGAKSRWVGLIAAVICGVTLFAGSEMVSLAPKPVLGGITLFLGLSFLVEWIYDARFKLPKLDYLVVILILMVIATLGFLQGVAIGFGVAVVLAVIHYSRTHVIRTVTSGAIHTNPVYRPWHQKQLLGREGEQIRVFELQGFLFFGNANKLLNQIRQQLHDATRPSPKFVILDFHLVKELDSSATLSFVKLEQIAHHRSLTLVFTHLSPAMKQKLYLGGCFRVQPATSLIFATLAEGLAWCEERILADFPWCHHCSLPLALRLDDWFCHTEQVAVLTNYLEEREVAAEEVVFC